MLRPQAEILVACFFVGVVVVSFCHRNRSDDSPSRIRPGWRVGRKEGVDRLSNDYNR